MQAAMKWIERREKTRFPVERELRYKVLEGDTIVASGPGQTRDISSAGVGFICDHPLSAGGFVELSISWPVRLETGCFVRLIVFGRVVRSGLQRCACTVDKYEFRTQARTVQITTPIRGDSRLRRWAKEVLKAQRASA